MMLGIGKSSGKGGTSLPTELQPLPLNLDPILIGSQRSSRSGELKRVLRNPLGSTSEGQSLGGDQNRHASLASSEELKHFKASLQHSSKKACDMVKIFRLSISKVDKLEENLSSKKRQRIDVSSSERSGVNLEKMGNQLHRNTRDTWNQRMEQKPKDVGLVKRPRTSMTDGQADGKLTAPRQPTIKENREEKFPVGNAVSIGVDEKICRVPAGGDGWEKKIKRKRSVSAVGVRVMNGDADPRQATDSEIPADSKLCSSDSPGFRSKPSSGINVLKLNRRFESPSPSASLVARSDQEAATSPTDCADMLEKRVLLKGNKSNSREVEYGRSCSGLLIRGNLSRTQRTGSVTVLESSSNVEPTHGARQDRERPLNSNKITAAGVAKETIHALACGSSAQPMTKWGGQRHKRLRRAKLRSPDTNDSELQDALQGIVTSELGGRSSVVADDLHASVSNICSLKVRNELQKVASPAAVSESEESGALENELKEKAVEGCEVILSTSRDSGVSMPAKNKISHRDVGDGVRRQGRSGRGLLTRSVGPPLRDKPDGLAPKPPQSARPGPERNKSKSGRPAMKKLKDRKGLPRVASVLDSGPPELMDELDDHETLVAAANSARNALNQACSSRFWKKVESFFAFVSKDDVSSLKKQLTLVEELNQALSLICEVDCNTSDVCGNNEDADRSDGRQPNNLDQDIAKVGSFCAKFNIGRLCKFPSMFDRVASALIDDESEEVCHQAECKNLSPHTSNDSHCGSCNQMDIDFKDRDKVDSEVESVVEQNQKLSFLDRLSCNRGGISGTLRNSGISTSGYSNEHSFGDDEYSHLEVGFAVEICSGDPGKLQQKESHVSCFPFPDEQYKLMSLSDRLVLELRSIDLCPETLPDLAEEGEPISEDIAELKGKLSHNVTRFRKRLEELDKGITNGHDTDKRKLEEMAMDKTVEMAYKRRMAWRGPNTTRTSVRRVPNQVAAAFIRRTLARCKEYEETGVSCFSEPALQDTLFSQQKGKNDAKSIDCVGSGTASNTLNEALKHQVEAKGSGAISSMPDIHDTRGENIANLSSEQDSDKPGSSKVTTAFDIKSTAISGRRTNVKTNKRLKISSCSNIGFSEPPPEQPASRPVAVTSTRPIPVVAACDVPKQQPSKERPEAGEAIDFDNLTLDGNNDQDLTWVLNFEVDGLQDCDTAGLEVPPWDDFLMM